MRVRYLFASMTVLSCALMGGVEAGAAAARKNVSPALVAPEHEDGAFCKFYRVTNPKIVVLMIDRTLPVTNASDREDAKEAMTQALLMTEMGQRLRIITIREDIGSSKKLFDDCRPGRPKGIASLFEAPENPEDLKVDEPAFNNAVKAAVDAAVDERNRLQQSPQSAIINTIASVGRQFQGRLAGLVLSSDMIEGRLADLTPKPDAGLDVRTRNGLLEKAAELGQIPRLDGVMVKSFTVNLWDRKNRPVLSDATAKDLRDFWIDYFRMAGVSSVTIN
ncbi:hypothetical protein [Magnetospirillum sulfuroxidans]|uniref:Uncharacterized protein n=1 Tax=Magnetospirillum sulfuroxidans TaxID=611300 RepID=A0ABS5ICM1_9PROT|nr:hypothetical protein [Magnetospirillum sulfuroxidans]MBR9972172.1 hypothetical protein [Magnetospirillum sulfuroxidans]